MPLDVQVPVRLDEGESLVADCVRAEARNGDARLPPGLLRVQVLGGPQGSTAVRVFSSAIIDEPVATLQLTLGCNFSVSREFVLLAEPLPAVAQAPALPVVESASAPTAPAVVAPVSATASAATKPASGRAAPASSARPPAPRASARAQAVPRAPTEARPRLRLEPTEPVREAPTAAAMREAFDAVARAASSAEAAASAASAAQSRVVELESTLTRMTQEAKARDTELARLRQALADGARPSLDAGLLWSGLVSVLVALSLWLGWRLRVLRRQQEAAWAEAAAQVPAAASRAAEASAFGAADVTAPDATRTSPAGLGDFAALAPANPPPEAHSAALGLDLLLRAGDAHDAEGPQERTEVLPQVEPDEVWPVREVSIEELIDLDQQAEFFLALGQDTAAVDLLVAHLRDTGGGSPLTYLKLLEIYARQGDQAAYERLRDRFNQRYHAQAPEWGQDLMKGRSLEDYPEILPRLVQAWSRPAGAMSELEDMLMRSSRSAPLDLPAYRDVLFLYSLARDRVELGVPADQPPAAEAGDIDLLLPLDEPPAPMLDLEPLGLPELPSRDAVPTAPVDLDLSLPELDLDLDLAPPAAEGPNAWPRPPGAKDEPQR